MPKTPEEIEAARLASIENTPNADEIDPDTVDTDENISDEDTPADDANDDKPAADEDDEEFSISLTDDEDEDIDGDDDDPDDEPDPAKSKDSSVIREMRKKVKKLEREKKALERKHQAAETGTKLPELGEKPKIEDFETEDYEVDTDKFEAALLDYHERKRAHDAAAEEIKTKSEALQTAHEGRLTAYATRKAEIAETRDDIVDAEDAVKSALNVTMQGVFMTVADDPALLILALGKYPKRLEKLGAISDPLILAKEVVKLEGSLNVRGKSSSKTQPEKRMKRGTAATNGVSDTKLKQLQAKADKTGNRSELQAYQRELAKAKK